MADPNEGLEALKSSNRQRIQKLAQQGVTLNGLADTYVVRMLEYLCGGALPVIQEQQELFTATTLDGAEAAAARARLMNLNGRKYE
jgi:hypothetical protein